MGEITNAHRITALEDIAYVLGSYSRSMAYAQEELERAIALINQFVKVWSEEQKQQQEN